MPDEMAQAQRVPHPPRTLNDYPGLFYHQVSPATAQRMDVVRRAYLQVAEVVLTQTPPNNRIQALALAALEESLMRAIQSLAVYGEGSTRVVPGETPAH